MLLEILIILAIIALGIYLLPFVLFTAIILVGVTLLIIDEAVVFIQGLFK